ncbi:hypothetical protein NQL31_001941 [Lotmaria passim]
MASQSDTAAVTGGPSPPAMPARLRQLVVAVEQLTSPSQQPVATTSAVDPSSHARHADHSSVPSSSPATVASTAELLKLVDDIQLQYSALLELAEKAFATREKRESRLPPAQSGMTSGTAEEDDVAQEAEQRASELESTVAALQHGIRSKLVQSSRLVLLNSLRREVAERRQSVAKMEGVLSVVRQHVRF